MSLLQKYLHNRRLQADPAYANKYQAFMTARAYQRANPEYAQVQMDQNQDAASQMQFAETDPMEAGMADALRGGHQQQMDARSINQMVDPSTKPYWYNQVDQMMRSSDPTLQKQAMELQKGLMRTAFQGAGKDAPNAWREYQLAKTEGYAGNFQDWKRANRSTNYDPDPYVKLTDLGNLRHKQTGKPGVPGMRQSDLVNYDFINRGEGEASASAEASKQVMVGMQNKLFGPEGIYAGVGGGLGDRIAFGLESNIEQVLQSDPRFKDYADFAESNVAPLARSLGEKGTLSDTDIKRIMKMVPNITGVNPDSSEVARQKMSNLVLIMSAAQEGRRLGEGENLTDMLGVSSPQQGMVYSDGDFE